MSLGEAIGYVAFFGMAWVAVLLLAAATDNALRTLFNIKLFPNNYWQAPKSGSAFTHCSKCNVILIDRDYCRNCGEVNI
jgi:hypothetical protein